MMGWCDFGVKPLMFDDHAERNAATQQSRWKKEGTFHKQILTLKSAIHLRTDGSSLSPFLGRGMLNAPWRDGVGMLRAPKDLYIRLRGVFGPATRCSSPPCRDVSACPRS